MATSMTPRCRRLAVCCAARWCECVAAAAGLLTSPARLLLSGKTYLKLRPDRVAMQDATAQMAVLQVRVWVGGGRVSLATCAAAGLRAVHLLRTPQDARADDHPLRPPHRRGEGALRHVPDTIHACGACHLA
jgi:hypothetical protein